MSDVELYEDDGEIGLGEDDRKHAKSGNDVEWYKGRKNYTDRVAIIYFHTIDKSAVTAARRKTPGISREDILKAAQAALAARATSLNKTPDALTATERLDMSTEGVGFKKFSAHFQDGLGFVISRLGKDGPESDEVWKRLEPPKSYFSTLLLQYATDKDGKIDKDKFANGWSIKPWRFSPKRYDSIWKLNAGLVQNNLGIANQDLLLECKDAQYQNMDISGAGPALWLKNEKFRATVLAKAISEFYDKLVPFREMSTEQLRNKLGLGGSAVADVGGSSEFNDVLDNL